MAAVVFSSAISKIKHIKELLGQEVVHHQEVGEREVQEVYGWGNRENTEKAREFAQKSELPYAALGEGFVCYYGLSSGSYGPYSLVRDYSGIYYDASCPSDVELALNSDYMLPQHVIEQAGEAMSLMIRHGISKYTYAPDFMHGYLLKHPGPSRRVLVVDQSHGDMSVVHGGGSEKLFEDMLQAAIFENRDAQVWIKAHPDVIAGKSRGYLIDLADKYGVPVIAEDYNPFSIFQYFDRIYTVTSQMGFEALLAGKKVTCFGMPFYAGWGSTDDRMVCERRHRTRSITEIFAVAYLMYASYINPANGQSGSIFDVIDHLARLRQREIGLSGRVFALSMPRWRRAAVTTFLKTLGNSVVFISDTAQAAKLGIRRTDKVAVWGNENWTGADSLCEQFGCSKVVIEDGFIRSVGLGSDFVPPVSLCVDTSDGGIHYAVTRESGIERILISGDMLTPRLTERARSLRARIVELGITKYNVDSNDVGLTIHRKDGQKLIFVVGQVEGDVSIAMSHGEIKTNIDLLKTVREANPEAFIIFKPHPDVVAGNRIGGVSRAELLKLCNHIEVKASSLSIIDACDEVHVITSQVGFDAVIRGKRVFVYGTPFYAGWGQTRDLAPEYAFRRRGVYRTVDELVAAALILYPTYVNPETGDVWEAEQAVEYIANQIESGVACADYDGLFGRLRRQVRRLSHVCRGGAKN